MCDIMLSRKKDMGDSFGHIVGSVKLSVSSAPKEWTFGLEGEDVRAQKPIASEIIINYQLSIINYLLSLRWIVCLDGMNVMSKVDIDQKTEDSRSPYLWRNTNYLKILAANFMLYFSFMLLTPLLPLYLKDTFGADKDMIGFVLSGYTLMCLLVRPFSGYIVDSFPRKMVLLVCNFLFFLLFGGYLVAGSITAFAIFRTLHGAPFGATTVSASTVAIDVLHPSRRGEGIGYYGLSNNLATAIGPTVAIYLLHAFDSYTLLFWISIITSFIGVLLETTIKTPSKPIGRQACKGGDSDTVGAAARSWGGLDRFFLLKGWSEGLTMACFAFSYGVLSTYLAIYGQEELGITSGSGTFFTLLASGLMLSRLTGAKGLKRGEVAKNATEGICVSFFGYLLFAAVHSEWAFYASALIIGLGNGHMYPAFQTMFINLAPHTQRGTANSTILTSWDVGFGIGVLLGGFLAENISYHSAFWAAWIVNAMGAAFFFAYTKHHFNRNKLR